MIFNNIKHNTLIFLCILLTTYGCNNKNKKIIVENKVIIEPKKNFNKSPLIDKIVNNNKTKEESVENEKKILKEKNIDDNISIKNLNNG